MKFYRLGFYEWESHREDFLYNEEKEYSEIEFRELCAEITCEEMYDYWVENEKYIDTHENDKDTNYTKEQIRDLWGTELNEVRFEDVYYKVLDRIKTLGFKVLVADTHFVMDSCHGIMSEETKEYDENKLVIERYKLFQRIRIILTANSKESGGCKAPLFRLFFPRCQCTI